MDSKALIAVLLVSILVFGCTSPPSGGTTQPNATGPTGQTPGNQPVPPSNPNGTQPGAGTVPSGNGGTQPNGGNQPAGGADDLAGKTYEELIALGIPLQCDVTTPSGTTRLYKGTGDDMRSETVVSQGACPKVIGIVNGDKYYVGCEGGDLMPGSTCKWLEFTENASEENPAAGAYQQPDYSDVPPAKITCVPWVPDPSKLQAPGDACTFEDLMKNIPTQ